MGVLPSPPKTKAIKFFPTSAFLYYHLLLCHYALLCWTVVVCLSQLEKPPSHFLVEHFNNTLVSQITVVKYYSSTLKHSNQQDAFDN